MTPSPSPRKPLDLDAADRLLRAYMQAAMPPVWPSPPETMPPSPDPLATPHSLMQREQSLSQKQFRSPSRNARYVLALSLAGLLGLGWWIGHQHPTRRESTSSGSNGSILQKVEASNPAALKQLQKSENVKTPPAPKRLELP